jgi:signal peptide peptidase SppA
MDTRRTSTMSVRIPRILAAVYGSVWAVRPETLAAITATLKQAAAGKRIQALDPRKLRAYDTHDVEPVDDDPDEPAPPPYLLTQGGTAVITVSGIIGKHLSGFEMDCGGYCLDQLETHLATAANDVRVDRVLLSVDSPGGTATGVPEAATRVAFFPKPLIAYTDSQAASAAYWLMAGAAEIWIAPSADVGSIGVYAAVVDESAAWAQDGLKMELMKAGEHKAAGIPGLPLAPADRALIQAQVDEIYAEFTGAVSSSRAKATPAVMQGQTFRGQRGIEAGLADALVPSLDEALERFEAFSP